MWLMAQVHRTGLLLAASQKREYDNKVQSVVTEHWQTHQRNHQSSKATGKGITSIMRHFLWSSWDNEPSVCSIKAAFRTQWPSSSHCTSLPISYVGVKSGMKERHCSRSACLKIYSWHDFQNSVWNVNALERTSCPAGDLPGSGNLKAPLVSLTWF